MIFILIFLDVFVHNFDFDQMIYVERAVSVFCFARTDGFPNGETCS